MRKSAKLNLILASVLLAGIALISAGMPKTPSEQKIQASDEGMAVPVTVAAVAYNKLENGNLGVGTRKAHVDPDGYTVKAPDTKIEVKQKLNGTSVRIKAKSIPVEINMTHDRRPRLPRRGLGF